MNFVRLPGNSYEYSLKTLFSDEIINSKNIQWTAYVTIRYFEVLFDININPKILSKNYI